jgi:hypothetical protein
MTSLSFKAQNKSSKISGLFAQSSAKALNKSIRKMQGYHPRPDTQRRATDGD